MIDLYLKAATKAAMDAALLSAGLIDKDGNPVAGVCLDRIGSYDRVTGYDAKQQPILESHPEYHANARLMRAGFDTSALAAVTLVPPSAPFRVWL